MAGLQGLEEKFEADGLEVLGFLSNDFGMQGGDPGEIDACTDKYNVTFDQFAIDHVIGADAQPVFAWLFAQGNPGPASTTEPTWNFHKYLVSREGKLVAHWDSPTYPGDDPADPNDSFDTNPIVVAIKAELAK
jgi:glutathione peroxidase